MKSARGAWVFLVVVTAACSGSTFESLNGDGGGGGGGGGGDGGGSADGGGGGGHDSGSGGDSGGGGVQCPPNLPTGAEACAPDGFECEYGHDPNPSCNAVARCSGGHWQLPPHASCPPPTTCPSSYGDVPVSQKCTPSGEACAYKEGTCYCTQSGPGGVSVDPRWLCVPTPTGCPSRRPAIGSSCSQPGLSCDYGACSGGAAVQCKDGNWQRVFTPCPV